MSWRRFFAAWAFGTCFAPWAWAHDPGISTAQVELGAAAFVLTTGFAPADVQQLLPSALRHEGAWTQSEFDGARERLLALAPELWEIRAGGRVIPPRELRVELLPGDSVSYTHVYPRESSWPGLTLRALKIGELPSGHRQFLIVADEAGSVIAKKLMKAEDAALDVTLDAGAAGSAGGAQPGQDATWWEFIKLGVEHIATGYDHLLFLFGLLVVCRSFRSIVAIISCFTLAHSITLAVATLDWVQLPPRLVEPAIAASIVFVGVENVLRRGEEPRGRWALTFAFGLIHGFGFASVLRDLGIGRGGGGVALPLVTFNLGVEIGQIAIAAAVLPVVWWLRKSETFVRRGVPAFSAGVALAGLYWLLERTLFS
ncbi:MAG: HupE/UreJ family protein [Opitutaceae bacterium]